MQTFKRINTQVSLYPREILHPEAQPAFLRKSQYGFVHLRVRVAIAVVWVKEGMLSFKNKREGFNDEKNEEAQSPIHSPRVKISLNRSFPGLFTLGRSLGEIQAGPDPGEVQQRPSRLLQLLVQFWSGLVTGSFNRKRALDGERATDGERGQTRVPLLLRILVAVEALAAGAAALARVTAGLVQGGQRGWGRVRRAALEGRTAVIVVLLRVAAHQDWIRTREVYGAVRVTWGPNNNTIIIRDSKYITIISSIYCDNNINYDNSGKLRDNKYFFKSCFFREKYSVSYFYPK